MFTASVNTQGRKSDIEDKGIKSRVITYLTFQPRTLLGMKEGPNSYYNGKTDIN